MLRGFYLGKITLIYGFIYNDNVTLWLIYLLPTLWMSNCSVIPHYCNSFLSFCFFYDKVVQVKALGFHSNNHFWYCVVTVILKSQNCKIVSQWHVLIYSDWGIKIHQCSIFPLGFLTSTAILYDSACVYAKFKKKKVPFMYRPPSWIIPKVHCMLLMTRTWKMFEGDVTRDNWQQWFLAQHRVAMLEQCCNNSKRHHYNVAMPCCAW